jgi:GGDEF domain-containing protein
VSGEENALFISATNKENFEEFRERVYEAVRHIHVTVSLTISFIQIIKMLWRKKTKRRKRQITYSLKKENNLILLILSGGVFCMPQLSPVR